jgi:dUTP pyrophosphatase
MSLLSNTFMVNVKKMRDDAIIPTQGSKYAAGYDLYAAIDAPITIKSEETVKIGTGLAFELPEGFFAGIFARSGLATKQGLRPANCVGVVDCDYRGEVIVAIHNDSNRNTVIAPGDRIAQMVLLPYQSMEFTEVNDLNETDRGDGGFGSSGNN